MHLENVPRIRDVETLVELHPVRRRRAPSGRRATRSRSTRRQSRATELDPALCRKIRASILLAGPLLARCGEIELPPPGGDVIGRRRVDTHFLALEQLGATFELDDALHPVDAKRLRGADVFLDEPSVTGTENALVGRRRRRGNDGPAQRRERAARAGPRAFPRRAWARRSRASARTRSPSTAGGRSTAPRIAIGPDHIEVGSFIGLAAVTRSEITHRATPASSICAPRSWASSASASSVAIEGDDLVVPAKQEMVIRSDLGGARAEARGSAVAGVPGGHDVDRARHGDAVRGRHPHPREDVRVAPVLRRQADRHGRADRALRSAPRARRRARRKLRGGDASSRPTSAPAWRCCSPRCAPKGESTINNVGQIERGYERIDERLRALGAQGRARGGPPIEVTRVGRRRRDVRDRRRGRRALRASFGITRVHDRTRAPAASARSPTSRCATSWRAGARCARLRLGGARARDRGAGARRRRARARGGWEGWLRGDDADGHLALERGTAMAVTVADCVPVFIAHPSGADGAPALGLARHGGADHRARDRRARSARASRRPSCACTAGRRSAALLRGERRRRYAQLTGRDPGAADDGRSARAHRRPRARARRARTSRSSPSCTRCDNDRFFSHRAGDAGRQLGVMHRATSDGIARESSQLDPGLGRRSYFRCCERTSGRARNVGEAPHIFLFSDGCLETT